MQKSVLILLSFVPSIIGYILNLLLGVPVIGIAGFYLLPLLTTAFWFYLGKQYAHSAWKTISSILISHSVGICSLLIYLWQFFLETEETRNMILAGSSQMFSASTPMYLFGWLAILFESQPNYAGRTTFVAMQVIALVYMVIVFSVAILWEKKRLKNVTVK